MLHVLYSDGLTVVPLEDVLGQMMDALSGNDWDPRQNADLVVIGQTNDDRYYILNEPSEEAMELLAEEYAGNRPKIRDVNRMRLCRVTVRNMKYSGFASPAAISNGPATMPSRGGVSPTPQRATKPHRFRL